MALTQTQVSQLYVTLFGRASEGSGNKYWQAQSDMAVAAQMMLDTAAAKTYFGTSMDDNQKFIEHIYKNTLNKTVAEDAAGIKFWVDALNAGNSRGFIASELLKAAVDPKNAGQAQDLFNNKVAISDYTAGKVQNVASASAADLKPFVDALSKVTHDPATIATAKAFVDTIPDAAADTSTDWVSTPATPGETFTLTNHTDTATANVFNAPMTYNPAGTDRILSLQDEDVLTGTAGRTDNTLNVTLGMQNANEGTGDARTPVLKNIQYLNAKVTGDVNKLDLRYADSLTKVNVDQVTLNASDNVKVLNIGTKLEGMRVANAAKETANINFQFKEGVLAGTADKGLLELNQVLAKDVIIDSQSATPEGYEKLDLTSKSNVDIDKLVVNQLQELTIKGSGKLQIANLKINDANQPEFTKVEAGGIVAAGSTGLTKLDASGFNGKLTLDISEVINPKTNPFSSGKDIPVDIIGSGNDDVFYSTKSPGKNTKLNTGAGNDKFVLISADIPNDGEKITNLEVLELRTQGAAKGSQKVDFDSFDDALNTVVVRDETQAANVGDDPLTPLDETVIAKFKLDNVTEKFAKEGKIVIEHSATTGTTEAYENQKKLGAIKDVNLEVNLKDASGKDDTVTVEVVNANNTEKIFNYEINADGMKKDQKVENITVIDSDTEDNVVKFMATHKVGALDVSDHIGTITLKGGTEKLTYTVDGDIFAKTLDASMQLSDLRLSVQDQPADIGQTIKLGKGDDILTFSKLDGFDAKDVLTDAGGHDVVRAAFSKDSALTLDGIEELHLVATKNVELDVAKANVEKVIIMSDKAVDGQPSADKSKLTPEPFNITADVDVTDIITFKNSNLKELNFFGDLDSADQAGTEADPFVDEDKTQKFNGVTLRDNKAEDLAININASLDSVKDGATNYEVGQITVHGSKNITINVGDEDKKGSETLIHNIYGKDIKTLVANAKGNLDLQTVTADAQNRGITLVDATKVLGDFKANVIALGDNAEVKLGDGDNVFSALNSAGKLINIAAGKGDNEIEGSAQSDTITTGNGHNVVKADRGDNVVTVGNGDDKVEAKDGNDTIVLGEGYDSFVDNKGTALDATKATTAVTKEFGAAAIELDIDGDDTVDVDQWIAVGKGSELKVQWEGSTLKAEGTVLDGARATELTNASATGTGDANANLFISKVTGTATKFVVNGNGGNDVFIEFGNGNAVKFNGGDGNDAAVGGDKSDLFIGGKDADVFVMQNTKNKELPVDLNSDGDTDDQGEKTVQDKYVDNVKIADGDSLAGSHDVVYGFDVTTATAATILADASEAGTAGRDALDLDNGFTALTANAANTVINGADAGKIKAHAQSATNFITFFSVDNGDVGNPGTEGNYVNAGTSGVATDGTLNNTLTAGKYDAASKAMIINEKNLADALAYLAKFFDGSNQTVAFAYDRNGDGKYTDADSIFVFQDGHLDTVVELVGTMESGGLTNAKAGLQALAGTADGLISIG
ncbi:hypothetical protein [Campylobacter sp. RM15925]|uniref:DUF4214 domain-containing protein n=1 Tax=Campylobacter sp. RM15925 TaxID=1705724 RepID=UPI00147508B5|nr:hypothetical protein [Campylobacter sp. RM15925]